MSIINTTDSMWSVTEAAVLMDSDGSWEKILAMGVLGLGSFLAGMLPAIIQRRNPRRTLTTTLLLCFGAGILLATALVHILPEVREKMKSNYAEIALCGGFFMIYFIDEFIHYFFGEALQHTHTHTVPSTSSSINRDYGTVHNTDREPLLNAQNNLHSADDSHAHSAPLCQSEEAIADANARICHTSHTEPCVQTMTGTLGLFVALSIHSAIEGLAIGIQNSAKKVLFLLGAVACHKFVMGFCLGLEFRSNSRTSLRSHVIGILVFAAGAVCGIGVGMIIIDIPTNWALPIIQAFAGGTLFYVTVCEVIPREKAHWHQNTARKLAGFAQFLAVVCGFTIMCVINYYFKDDDS